jgi:hypothetical protein
MCFGAENLKKSGKLSKVKYFSEFLLFHHLFPQIFNLQINQFLHYML